MGQKTVLTILVFLVVILLGTVATGGYFLYKNDVLVQDEAFLPVQKEEQVVSANELYNASIDDMVLNITSSKGRLKLMKFSFTLKSTDPMIDEMIQNNKEEIIDIVISQVSQRNSEELLTIGGQVLLKEDLVAKMNQVVNSWRTVYSDMEEDNIKKILFTDFVMK